MYQLLHLWKIAKIPEYCEYNSDKNNLILVQETEGVK